MNRCASCQGLYDIVSDYFCSAECQSRWYSDRFGSPGHSGDIALGEYVGIPAKHDFPDAPFHAACPSTGAVQYNQWRPRR